MGIKIVFFINLLNCLFSYNLFEAASINGSNLIIDIMINDINTCANNSIVIQSKYVKQACNISYPDKPSDIKKENLNQYLCIVLYDQSVKNCLQKTEKKDLLGNQTVFDKEIDNILKTENKLDDICTSLTKKLVTFNYNKTKPFLDKLNTSFQSLTKCILTCSILNSDNSDFINPLCAVIYYVDQKLNNELNKSVSVLTSTGVENDKTKDVSKPSGTDNVSVQKSKPNPGSQATENDHPNAKKESVDTKKTDSISPPDSDATTTKNSGNKINSNIQDDKTPSRINEDKENLPTTDKKEEIKDEIGVEKPEIFDQPSMDGGENTIPHPDDDNVPEDESDLMDDDTKMNDQDSLAKPEEKKDTVPILSNMQNEDDSHFLGYFTILGIIGISGCLAYHHKQKILAILLEGRRSRGGRGRRRPSTANYRKLDCTLEEAVTSQLA